MDLSYENSKTGAAKKKTTTGSHHRFFNSLSNIPMLDTSHLADESFYKTTYREDFVKKNRLRERKIEKPADFSVYSKQQQQPTYDYKELSTKLAEKNNKDNNEFASDSILSNKLSKSAYWYDSRDPEAMGIYDSNTETRASFNGNFHVYQRPVIPQYIKRDNFYQTNAERNIGFLRTEQGLLIPNVPDTSRKEAIKNRLGDMSPRRTMLDNFFLDKLTESQFSFSSKEPTVSAAKIMSHLRRDNMYHTNAARNTRYVKTNNNGLVNYVPVDVTTGSSGDDRFNSSSSLIFNDASQMSFNGAGAGNGVGVGEGNQENELISLEPQKPNVVAYDNNHLKIKLGNPESEHKRNFSILQGGPRMVK